MPKSDSYYTDSPYYRDGLSNEAAEALKNQRYPEGFATPPSFAKALRGVPGWTATVGESLPKIGGESPPQLRQNTGGKGR